MKILENIASLNQNFNVTYNLKLLPSTIIVLTIAWRSVMGQRKGGCLFLYSFFLFFTLTDGMEKVVLKERAKCPMWPLL